MNTQEMTQEQIRATGLKVLTREPGASGLVRFLQAYEPGQGDYTKNRADILPPATAAAIAEQIRRHNNP